MSAPHEETSIELLRRATEEAARLLDADGAMVYLVDESGEKLRFAVDAGIEDPDARTLIRDLSLPVGVGLFGTAVAKGEAVVTGDYRRDRRFRHARVADRIVTLVSMRSMAATPLIAEGRVLGAMGAFTSRANDFDEARIGLLRALADHAATAIANARLIDQLARSEAELARRVDAQRTLGEITARLTSIHEPDTLLQQVVDAAKRLLETDGAHLTLLAPDGSYLQPTVIAGGTDPANRQWLGQQEFPIGEGINGLAARDCVIIATEDYLVDPRIPHEPTDQEVAQRMGLRGMAAAPLRAADGRVIGTLAVSFEQPHVFEDEETELLQGLADHAAIAIANAELTDRLRASAAARRALGEIGAQITSLRDPAAVLQRTIDEAVRLLGADGGQIALIGTDESGTHYWIEGPPSEGAISTFTGQGDATRIADEGVSGRAVATSSTVWTDDYLNDDSFLHGEAVDEFVRANGVRSVIAAPLTGEGGAFGALAVQSTRPAAFDEASAELLASLADQAAIAMTNARLYQELRGRIDAQRAVGAIAAEIAALHDPSAVIQRTADEAARLLGAESAMINPVDAGGAALDWAVAHSPADQPLDDVVVPLGEGVSGRALAEGRVVWTGDYLADTSFTHTPELDEYVARRGTHSLMAAPLAGGEGSIGTLTVQSTRRNAFGPVQAEMLEMLALQAAVAVTNARLYDELRDSERRYRFLVDYSPDVVWSMDNEGRFTFLSESLERQTGFKAGDFIGRHFADLTDPASVPLAAEAFERLRARPDEPQRVRIELPTVEGGTVPVEITMMARVIDGQVVGAHGSGRDVSERERLERDLRRQAAELAAGQERAHLARELHDSVTQALFSIGLTIRSLELLFETDPAEARVKMAELRELQKDALAEMRALIFELRPQGLEKDGLVQALRNQAAAVEGRTGLSVSAEADETAERLPLETEEALFRIAQEALHNVVKHAGASWARIRFDRADAAATLSVSDDGAGFDPERVPRGHLGLAGMRQRVDRLGGELTIESRPGAGSTISVTVPVDASVSSPLEVPAAPAK